jgi:hypothetical protein
VATKIDIERVMLELLAQRDADVSICPSEVARALEPHSERAWREMMPRVRDAAADMARVGRIRITRGDVELDLGELTGGPMRLRRGAQFEDRG